MTRSLMSAAGLLAGALAACGPSSAPSPSGEPLRGRERAGLDCAAANAVYRLRSDPGPELRFVATPQAGVTGMALKMTADGATHWFWLTESVGYGALRATRGPDPTDDVPEPDRWEADAIDSSAFTAFDLDFNALAGIPAPSDPAPAHLFAPEMGISIWFATSDQQNRTFLPVAMWDFSRCAAEPS